MNTIHLLYARETLFPFIVENHKFNAHFVEHHIHQKLQALSVIFVKLRKLVALVPVFV